ncbi:hypothetical protein ACFJGW_15885 [Burkholderiaceae bacterium UC74_6]
MKTSISLSSLLSLALITGAASAAPRDDINRVEVTGQKAALERYDVRHACPQVDVDLRDKLARAWHREEPVGEMVVRFKLEGSEVSNVKMEGMYAPNFQQTRVAVRRGVKSLSCASGETVAQNYAFKLVFIDPNAAAPADRVALLEIQP